MILKAYTYKDGRKVFEVSTMRPGNLDGGRYETCLFDETNHDNEVVAVYSSQAEAEIAHAAISLALDFAVGDRG